MGAATSDGILPSLHLMVKENPVNIHFSRLNNRKPGKLDKFASLMYNSVPFIKKEFLEDQVG